MWFFFLQFLFLQKCWMMHNMSVYKDFKQEVTCFVFSFSHFSFSLGVFDVSFSFLAALCSSLVFGTLYKRPGGPSSLWQTTPASEQSWGAATQSSRLASVVEGFGTEGSGLELGSGVGILRSKDTTVWVTWESTKVLMRLSTTEIATQEAFISMQYYSANYNRLARQRGSTRGRCRL